MRSLWSLLLCFVMCTSAAAQLDVVSTKAAKLSGAKGLTQIGDSVFVDVDSKLQIMPVRIVRIDSEAKNITIEVTDQRRDPVEYQQITKNVIVLSKPGKFWVDVTAIDFDANIYGRKTLVVEVGSGPTPPVPPTPPDPSGPFDGLAARVAAVAVNLNASQRNQISGICSSAADKMQSFEFKQVDQAKSYISRNWPRDCQPCRDVLQLVSDDAKKRSETKPFSWQETQAYYREIAKGVM